MESELMHEMRKLLYTGRAAFYAHPAVDFDKAAASVSTAYSAALNSIDYIGGGQAPEDAAEAARMKFVQQFLELRKRSLKEHVEITDEMKEEPDIKAVDNG